MHKKIAFILAFLSCSIFPIGCGGGSSSVIMTGDDGAITAIVEDINDAKMNARFASLFAVNSVPTDQRKYAILEFYAVGKPTVSGTTATSKVSIVKAGGSPAEVEWTFEKVGEKWKIKSAPLP